MRCFNRTLRLLPCIIGCVGIALHAHAAQLGPPKDIWDRAAHAKLFTGKVLVCPAPYDATLAAWEFDAKGTWPRSFADAHALNLRTESGELRFTLGANRVRLGWGSANAEGKPAPKAAKFKVISFPGDRIAGGQILIRMRQSKPGSRWRIEPCYRGDPRDTGLWVEARGWTHAAVEVKSDPKSTDWQTLKVRCCQLASADGLAIEVHGAKGSEVAIDYIRVVKSVWDIYARKAIDLPPGRIFSARATAPVNASLWVNGQLVRERRPCVSAARYQLLAVDLKPYLRPGRNVVALYEFCRMAHTPICYLQGAVQMASGQTVPIVTGPDWKTQVRAKPGWQGLTFDDSGWLPPGDRDPTGYLRDMRPYTDYQPGRVPAYCGQVELENPCQHKLFFDAGKPIKFRVRLPGGLEPRRPVVRYEVWDDRSGQLVNAGQAAQWTRDGDALAYDLALPTLGRGVYTLLLDAGRGPWLKRQETFIVAGRIPMPQTDGRTWDAGMTATLVDEIDCTNPADPHPFCDGGVLKPEFKSEVVTRNGLTYRESPKDPAQTYSQYAWFSYKFKFRTKGKPHWVEIDYPDDADRLIEAQVLPLYRRPHTENHYGSETSWATPGVQTGGKYPNTGKLQPFRMVVWSHEIDAAIVLTGAGKGSVGPAAARIRIYEIDQLPALETQQRGRRLGLFTERASVMERTYGGSPRLEPLGHNPYLTWFDEAEKYAQYCRFTGQNAYFMGCYQYTYDNAPSVAPDTGAEGCSLVPSQRDVFINVLGANGIVTYSGVEFRTDPRDWHKGWPALHQVRDQGADLMFQVDKNGLCRGGYHQRDNPMTSPIALDSMARDIRHIVDRFGIYPSWKGVALALAPKWEGPTYDSADVSFDDQTIRLFERETGVRVPVSFDDPQRFRKRYEFLVGEPRRRPESDVSRAWFDWRSEKLAQVHDALAKIVHERRPDADYMVYVEYPVEQTYGPARKPLMEMMRDVGYDPRAYAKRKAYYFGRDQWSFTPLAAGRAIGWEEWLSDAKTIHLFNSASGAGRGLFVRWGFDEWTVPALVLTKPAIWPGGYWINYGAPSHDYLPERFTLGLIDSDVDTLIYGFCDCVATVGGEHEMRRFAREFLSLPRARFERLTGNGLDRNIDVKAATVDGEGYFYVANPGWWECEVRLEVRGQGAVARAVDGAAVELAAGAEGRVLTVKLPPYGVAAFKSPDAQTKPVRAAAAVPAEATAYIKAKLAQCAAELAGSKADLADVEFVRSELAAARAAARAGDWATAWRHAALAAHSQAGLRALGR